MFSPRLSRPSDRAFCRLERDVNEIHAKNAHGFLLRERIIIKHINVQDNGVRFSARFGLETQADPAMAFIGALEKFRAATVLQKAKEARVHHRGLL